MNGISFKSSSMVQSNGGKEGISKEMKGVARIGRMLEVEETACRSIIILII